MTWISVAAAIAGVPVVLVVLVGCFLQTTKERDEEYWRERLN